MFDNRPSVLAWRLKVDQTEAQLYLSIENAFDILHLKVKYVTSILEHTTELSLDLS